MTADYDAIERRILDLGAKVIRQHALRYYEPYIKQREFHDNGGLPRGKIRAMIAANQVGKTQAGAFEDAVHLTGLYPPWWKGYRFTRPTSIWIAGPKQDKVRDTTQEALFGTWKNPDALGTGFIPKDAIPQRPVLARGVPGAYDVGVVRWKDKNGRLDESALSSVKFMCYSEGVLAFASENIDVFHPDEEPPEDILSEARVRLQVRDGIIYLTATPLLGNTTVIKVFNEQGLVTQMGIYDAMRGHDPERPHLGHYLSREQVESILASFPAHERDARGFGIPMLGEGRVFLTDERELMVPPFENVPVHLSKIWGLDFGGAGSGSHPFAAALLAWDRDYDIIFLLRALKLQGMTMLQHIPAIREVAALVPVAWPHDGNEKDRASGIVIADQYKNPMPGMPGLLMLPEHATWEDGGFSTEAAVNELDDRCKTGRFKVVETETHFADEYRQYHREKGLLVKKNDDVLSAIYKGLMMKRFARPVALGAGGIFKSRRAPTGGTAMDIDPFTGQPIRRVDNSSFF